MLTIDDNAEFGWSFGHEFFLEAESKGNYIWSDPDYGGDNTIVRFNGDLKAYCRSRGIPYVRDKGVHNIRNYCGDDVVIK